MVPVYVRNVQMRDVVKTNIQVLYFSTGWDRFMLAKAPAECVTIHGHINIYSKIKI